LLYPHGGSPPSGVWRGELRYTAWPVMIHLVYDCRRANRRPCSIQRTTFCQSLDPRFKFGQLADQAQVRGGGSPLLGGVWLPKASVPPHQPAGHASLQARVPRESRADAAHRLPEDAEAPTAYTPSVHQRV
jgi:hypothetical protein